jgi:hypothetical protein
MRRLQLARGHGTLLLAIRPSLRREPGTHVRQRARVAPTRDTKPGGTGWSQLQHAISGLRSYQVRSQGFAMR